MTSEAQTNQGAGQPQVGLVTRTRNYFGDSYAELKKVSHPTRQETIQATLVTLVIVGFMAICLFILDVIFSKLMLAIMS